MATRLVVTHNLGFKPKDVILGAIDQGKSATALPEYQILWNDPETNSKTIAILINQPCKLRLYVGKYEKEGK